MKKTLITILLLSLTLQVALADQHYYFNHFTSSDGLPSNTVLNVVQDSYGFMWIGTRDGISRYDGRQFTHMPSETGSYIMGGRTYSLHVDKDGYIWFSTSKGTGYYNPSTGEIFKIEAAESLFNHIDSDQSGNIWLLGNEIYKFRKDTQNLVKYSKGSAFPPVCIAVDTYGTVWMTSSSGDIYRYDQASDKFNHEISGNYSLVIPLERGKLLVSTSDRKVLVMDTINGAGEEIFDSAKDLDGSSILCLMEGQSEEFWIGTESGIVIYDYKRKGIDSIIQESESDIHAISASYSTCLSKDSEGNVWIGTFYKGLNLWKNRKQAYELIMKHPTQNSIAGKIVRSIVKGNDGNLWIGCEDGFLDSYNPRLKKFTHHQFEKKRINVQDVMVVGDNLWIGTFGDGIYVYNPESRAVLRNYSFPSNIVIRQIKTSGGKILAGTKQGLYEYNEKANTFSLVPGTSNYFIHALTEDRKGDIWVGTYGDGIFLFDKSMNLISHASVSSEEGSMKSNFVTSFMEDSRDNMWVSTEGGGISMTPISQIGKDMRFRSFDMKDGLQTDVVSSMAEDKDGTLWIATTKGISQMNLDTFTFSESSINVTQTAGNQYSYGASFKEANGTIYFGTTDGIIAINPPAMKAAFTSKPIYISGIYAENNESTSTLSAEGCTALTTDRIKVKTRDISILRIQVSSPSYSSLIYPSYEYTFKGNGGTIHSTTHDNSFSFTDLVPGKYTFTVWERGNDDKNAAKTLVIKIIPPVFKSFLAKVLYIIIGLTMLLFIVYSVIRRRKAESEKHMQEVMQLRQKEVFDNKISFFTNLTHEIRTPLTLIKMPLDKIIKAKQYLPEVEKEMLTIQKNADRLLHLTNELLDMERVESGEQKMTFTRQDICAAINDTLSRYSSLIEERKITVEKNIPDGPVDIMFGKEAIEKVLSNLITNAIKYGDKLLKVDLTMDSSNVSIRVSNDGELIKESDKERIFQKYVQGEKGAGLGLPLGRAIAEMHSGTLILDSSVEGLNSFVLTIPKEHPEQIDVKKIISSEENVRESFEDEEEILAPEYDSSRHTILVVEDDPDFRGYLASELSSMYNIIRAGNGKEACEILESNKIDLVISDIMMPLMDGCELCNHIKGTMEYSHIPVILLTAAVGMETRIETLEAGADGYIEKPFPIDLLMANISSLFKNREISYNQFANSPLTHYNSVTASKVDEEFMDKLHSTVMNHMSEQDLSIESLTAMMNTSKSTLYRKVKANTGLNINEYIRLCRLKQAAEMLSSQKYKVNEVGYLVGFSSPSYFATCFQKQFNISPSAFVKKIKD